MAAPLDSYCNPPPLPDSSSAAATDSVLLDRWCYIADHINATTAEGTTSTGLRIQVTFRAAPPPHLSHFCVHCPGLRFPNAVPKVIATDADLVLLCVPVYPDTTGHGRDWDYFVYGPRARRLDLVPNPNPRCLIDCATVLLSLDDDGGGGWYAVAALGVSNPVYNKARVRIIIRWDFNLHLYRSSDPSDGWITKVISVDSLARDRLFPLPDAVDERMNHETEKAIVIGGEGGGTVAWVDLWRGILFCDVLSDRPVLHDVPLPAPAKGNWNRLLRELDPGYFRDVTISRDRGCIRYIEMESWSRIDDDDELNNTAPASYSYNEWVRNRSTRLSVSRRDGWKATAWSMAIPVGDGHSHPVDDDLVEKCWHRHSEIDVNDVTLELDASNAALWPCSLWAMLCCSDSNTTQTFKELQMTCPIIGMDDDDDDDDDVVYLLSTVKPRRLDEFEVVLAIDVKKGVLRGLAELDVHRHFAFRNNIFSSDLCRHLRKVAGTVEASERT